MKSRKLYLWCVSLVVVALVGFTFSNLGRSLAEGAGGQQTNAPIVAHADTDPVPLCDNAISAAGVALLNGEGVACNTGFTTITHPTTGIYCLKLATPTTHFTTAQTSIDWAGSFGVALYAQWNSSNTTCGGNSSVIEVRTYKGDRRGVGSWLTIPRLSDEVAFTVVVP